MTLLHEPAFFYPVLVFMGFIAGFFGSMLGLGGGWLIVPVLQVFGIAPQMAVGTSLTAMIFTSLIGAGRYYYKKILLLSLGTLIAVPALLGVYFGKNTLSMLSDLGYSGLILHLSFLILLSSLGVSMLLSSRQKNSTIESKKRRHWKPIGPSVKINANLQVGVVNTAIIGTVAGFLSGLLGIGGGIVLTPVMVSFFGVPVVQAASASLISVLLSSLLGSGLYLFEGQVNFNLAIALAIGTSIGSFLGAWMAPTIPDLALKRIFGSLTVLTATALLIRMGDLAEVSVAVMICGSIILFLFTLYKRKNEPA